MIKCQKCAQPATNHITELVAGRTVEYHLCEVHLKDLDTLVSKFPPAKPTTGFFGFGEDRELREALGDPAVRQEMAAYVLPALCLALLHEKPEVRIAAAYRLMQLGPDGRSAAGALRDALQDPDERVAKAARIALEYIETDEARPWFV
jgi:HEAT repeats